MRLREQLFYDNECYIAARPIFPQGVMLHSTGANNPTLRRYVAPDDGHIGRNEHGNHWNQPRPEGRQVCVHAFIGLQADGTVATYQVLPWVFRGWHCAGKGNDTHISIELCEDGLTDAAYFAAVYREAVQVVAHLCRIGNFNPMGDGVVIDHREGYLRKIASNSGDVRHWFSRFGKCMDNFRLAVKREMECMLTQAQFDAMMDNWLERQAMKSASEWAKEGHELATHLGITDGSRPQAFATRQEAAIMAMRSVTQLRGK